MENTLSLSELKDLLLKRFKSTRSDWEGADSGGGGMSDINEYYELKELTVTPGIEKLLNNTSFPNESEKITWKLESYPLTDEDKYILKDAFDISDEELGDNPMWQEYLVVDKYNSIINKERAIIGSIPNTNLEQDAEDTESSMKINESIIKNKMKTTTLRELIRESIQGYIREIDMVSEIAAIESKIAEAKKAMEERNSKLAEAEKLNESGLIDERKVRDLTKEVALLEKYAAKQEALLEKKKAKMEGKSKKVNDDMITEEPMEEINGLEEMGYKDDSMEEAKEEMKEEYLNESFIRMQKLAGLITETQYRKKIQMLNEGVKLDTLMKDGKPNTEILVVPDQFYKNEDELRAYAMRPYEIKKEEGREDKMLFNIVGSQGGKHQASIKGDEVKDVILFDDAKKKLL